MGIIIYEPETKTKYRVLFAGHNINEPTADKNCLVVKKSIPLWSESKAKADEQPVMYYNPIKEEFWFEYVKVPLSTSEKMGQKIARLEQKLNSLIIELTDKKIVSDFEREA